MIDCMEIIAPSRRAASVGGYSGVAVAHVNHGIDRTGQTRDLHPHLNRASRGAVVSKLVSERRGTGIIRERSDVVAIGVLNMPAISNRLKARVRDADEHRKVRLRAWDFRVVNRDRGRIAERSECRGCRY